MPIIGSGANPPDAHRAANKGALASGFSGQYAWFFLSETEKEQYAAWKESDPTFGVRQGTAMPKNWRLLEEGSVPGVAARDVGVVGLHYIEAAQVHMQSGGTDKVVTLWQAIMDAEGK